MYNLNALTHISIAQHKYIKKSNLFESEKRESQIRSTSEE